MNGWRRSGLTRSARSATFRPHTAANRRLNRFPGERGTDVPGKKPKGVSPERLLQPTLADAHYSYHAFIVDPTNLKVVDIIRP